MHAITVSGSSAQPLLRWTEVPDPELRVGEVLIDVAAAGVNRADLLQARGRYAPPPGASGTLGLECSGTIAAVYDDSLGFAVGDEVCALMAGGGYAEQVAVPARQVLPLPHRISLIDAAALPEAACTVWSNLVMIGGLTQGTSLLVHGGASGIGTMAIQVGAALGAHVFATASTDEKLAACRLHGADFVINYTTTDFVREIDTLTLGTGVDLVLDVVGGDYLARNIEVIGDGGRIIVIGLLGGARAELDLAALMAKRGGIIGTQLRSRAATGTGSKAEIVAEVLALMWPLIDTARIDPVVGARLPMTEADEAHRMMLRGEVIGKIVLTRPDAAA